MKFKNPASVVAGWLFVIFSCACAAGLGVMYAAASGVDNFDTIVALFK